MNNPKSEIQNPQPADGVLVIDKPAGWTSHDVVAKVRKIINTRRVGHTGTLDPFATGVLVVCVNRATRLVQYLTGDDKQYVATMRLGFATDTADLTGQPIQPIVSARHITKTHVQEAFSHFRRRIRQIPPMYSAKKIDGVRLHELARRGKTVERQPVEVEIKELELLPEAENVNLNEDEFAFRVLCSSGTYIRTLAEDIGKSLGVGAHLTKLCRTRSGRCHLSQSLTLDNLDFRVRAGELDQIFIRMNDALALKEILLNDDECKAIVHGRSIARRENLESGEEAQLLDSDRQLLAVAEYDSGQSVWRPRVVLAEAV